MLHDVKNGMEGYSTPRAINTKEAEQSQRIPPNPQYRPGRIRPRKICPDPGASNERTAEKVFLIFNAAVEGVSISDQYTRSRGS